MLIKHKVQIDYMVYFAAKNLVLWLQKKKLQSHLSNRNDENFYYNARQLFVEYNIFISA